MPRPDNPLNMTVTRMLFVGDSTVSQLFHSLLKFSEEFEDSTMVHHDSSVVIVRSEFRSYSLELHDLSRFDFDGIDEATIVIFGVGVEWMATKNLEIQDNASNNSKPIDKMEEARMKEPITTFQKKQKVYQYFTKYVRKIEELKKRLDNISKERNIFWFLDQEDSTKILSRKDMEVLNEIASNIIVKTRVS